MPEEVKPEENKKADAAVTEPTAAKADAESAEEKEGAEFSFDSTNEELPAEIREKLEKNKAARTKKKLVKKKKKKVARVVKVGRAYIQATYNNTMMTLTDPSGDVIAWASAGLAGFKGAKKATPYAAQIITKIATQKAREEYGLEEVSVFVSGVGTGREAAIRALNANGLNVTAIKDITPVPHNGCRPKKPRRV
jgi:small subunit ribosomal protein S11